MSKTIDERVLQMEFDNKRFEKSAKESIQTLKKLDESCQMDRASEGFAKLEAAIDNINNHFTILGRVSEKITDRIATQIESTINTVARLTKSLSVDQIAAGYNKYESITASTQTIMGALSDSDKANIQSKGVAAIDYVNEQLDRMNQYTDETSYNLSDMTDNVGKFMSAGIDLETSVSAMEGIANWAARSGANIEQASRAMYNFSQALGSGAMMAVDWKSIENANMATKEFKELAISTAKEMGKLDQAAPVDAGTFRESLSDRWFTTDVMVAVLQKYNEFYNQLLKIQETEEGAGMTVTSIIGELQDGTELGQKWISDYGINLDSLSAKAFLAAQEYKSFTDVVNATADAVSTSWMNIYKDIFGNLEESKDLWSRVGDDFYDIFAQPVADIQSIVHYWKEFGGRNYLLDAFDNVREAIDSFVGPIKDAFSDIFGMFGDDNTQKSFGARLVGFTKQISVFTKSLIASEDASNGIRTAFRQVFRVVQLLSGGFLDLARVGNSIVVFFFQIIEGISGMLGSLEKGELKIDSFSKANKTAKEIILGLSNAIHLFILRLKKFPLIGSVVKWLEQLIESIGKLSKSIEYDLEKRIDTLKNKLEEITGKKIEFTFRIPNKDDIISFIDSIVKLLNHVKDVFNENINKDTFSSFIKTLAKSLNILKGELDSFLKGKYDQLMAKDGPIQTAIRNITGFSKKTSDEVKAVGKVVKDTFLGIDWGLIAKFGLVGAMILAVTKFKKQTDELLGIGLDMKESVSKAFNGTYNSIKKVLDAASTSIKTDAIVKCAESIAILAGSVILLATVDQDALARCTVSLLALMLGLSKLMDSKTNRALAKAAGTITGLGSVFSSIAVSLSVFLNKIGLAATIVSVAVAMTTLSFALMKYTEIDWLSLGKAGAALGGFVTGVSVLMMLMSSLKNLNFGKLVGLSTLLSSLPGSMVLIAYAIKIVSSVKADVDNALSVLSSFAIFFGEIIAISAIAQKISNGKAFKGLSKTLLALSAVAVTLGVMSTISDRGVKVLTSAISQLAGALIVLIGAATLSAKFGLASHIESIIKALTALSKVTVSLSTFNVSIAALLAVMSLFPDGLSKLAKSIKDNASIIGSALVKVLQYALLGMVAYKAKFATEVVLIISAIVEAMGDKSEFLIDNILKIAGDVLTALSEFIQKASSYIVPATVGVVNSIASAIDNNKKSILDAIGNLWNSAINLFAEGISRFTGLDIGDALRLSNFIGKSGLVVLGIKKVVDAIQGIIKPAATATSSIQSMFKSIMSTPSSISTNFKTLIGWFNTFRDIVFEGGVKMEGFATVLSNIGSIGKVAGSAISSFGKGLEYFSIYLPVITGVTAALGGLYQLSKSERANVEKGIQERYGLSDADQKIIDSSKELQSELESEIETYHQNTKTIEDKWNSYEQLGKQYDSISDKSSATAQSIREQLTSALGINSDKVDELIAKYGSLEQAIRITFALQEAQELIEQKRSDLNSYKEKLKEKQNVMIEDFNNYNKAIEEQSDLLNQKLLYKQGTYEGQSKDAWVRTYMATNNATHQMAEAAWSGLGDFLDTQYDAVSKRADAYWEAYSNNKKYSDLYTRSKEQLSKLETLYDEAAKNGDEASLEALQKYMDSLSLISDNFIMAGEGAQDELKKQADALKDILDSSMKMDLDPDIVEDNKKTLQLALEQLGSDGISYLDQMIENAKTDGNTKLTEALSDLRDGLVNPSEEVVTDGTKSVAKSTLENIINEVASSGKYTDTWKEGLKNALGGIDLSDSFSGDQFKLINGIMNALSKGDINSDTAFADISKIISEGIGTNLENDTTIASSVAGNVQHLVAPATKEAFDLIDLTTSGETASDTFNTGITNKCPTIAETCMSFVDRIKGILGFDGSAEGSDGVLSFNSGMNSKSSEANESAASVAENAKSGLESSDTYSSGSNFIQGFVNAINDATSWVSGLLAEIGNTFIGAFNGGLKEHSPSKASYESGYNFLKGFANAINDYTSPVSTLVKNSGDQFVNELDNAIGMVQTIIDSNDEFTPTITPVLDLSQIQNGSSQIASLFDNTYTMRAASSASGSFVSPAQIRNDNLNNAMSEAMKQLIEAQSEDYSDPTYTFNIPLEVNGRQIAKATRSYTRTELDNLNTIMDRKAGIK